MISTRKASYQERVKQLAEIAEEIAPRLAYHNFSHALDVSQACRKYAKLEGRNAYESFVLEIASLLHDIVYVQGREDNEEKSAEKAREILSKQGYQKNEIEEVARLILATKCFDGRKDILEKIINDADLDYVGRDDFFEKSELLRQEAGIDKEKWYGKMQPAFLSQVKYYTASAKRLRGAKLKENLERIRRENDANEN